MNYQELKNKHEKEVNEYLKDTAFFAFSNEQLKEGMAKLNVSPENKIFELGAGGYMLSSARDGWHDLLRRQKQELKDFRQSRKNLAQLIRTEMNNHEYIYNPDDDLILDVCGISKEEFSKDKNLQKIYKKVRSEYWQEAVLTA